MIWRVRPRHPPRALAAAIEAERFDRFGLDQGQVRMTCRVILAAIERLEIRDLATLKEALHLYPAAEWHVDPEEERQLR